MKSTLQLLHVDISRLQQWLATMVFASSGFMSSLGGVRGEEEQAMLWF